ncbi:MAG: hypothetical protein WC712_02575 [Candidatus Brocadiia bacterium]
MRARPLGLLIPALLLFALSISTAEEPAAAMKETVICAVTEEDATKKMAVSPDHRHCAFIRKVDKGEMVIVDGKEGKVFNKVLRPFYSPDSTKVAYAGFDGKSWTIVENGKVGPKYDKIDEVIFLYTPDSKNLIYVATKGGKQFVVSGGKDQKPYKEIQGIRLSTDGKHIAVHASDSVSQGIQGPGQDQDFWSIDGDDLTDYTDPMGFAMSPNGKRYALIGRPANGEDGFGSFIIVDGEKREKLGSFMVSSLSDYFVFSPDSKRLAYVVESDDKDKVILDGKSGSSYKGVEGMTFSPCNKHFAFFSGTKETGAFHLDGKTWKTTFASGNFETPPTVFCGDKAAIRVKTDEGECVVENDVAGDPYKWVSLPIYNSKKEVCYLASADGKLMFIAAGKTVCEVEGGTDPLLAMLRHTQILSLVGTAEQPAFLFSREKESWIAVGEETYGPFGSFDGVKSAMLPRLKIEKLGMDLKDIDRPADFPEMPNAAEMDDANAHYTSFAFANGTLSLIAEKDGNLVLIEVKVK